MKTNLSFLRVSGWRTVVLLLLTVTLPLGLPFSNAEEVPAELSAVELFPGAYAQGVKSTTTSLLDSSNEIKVEFSKARSLVHSGELGLAGKSLDRLNGVATREGYLNLPDYSMILLSEARKAEENGNVVDVGFLVLHAELLSPSDPRVQLVAASLYRSIGIGAASMHLFEALKLLPSYPLVAATLGLNFLLLTLVATTIAFFVVCVVQLVRNAGRIFVLCSRVGPRSIRGYSAVALLLTLMILPFFGGLLVALGCWALVISRTRESARWLPAFVGVLALVWGLSLPISSTVSYNAQLDTNNVMQDLSNMSFSPKGEEYLTRSLAETPHDPLLLISFGQMQQLKGQDASAEASFRKVVADSRVDSGLRAAAQVNLAVLEFNRSEYAKARDLLEAQRSRGVESFELYYNLALTHLALLDTSKHREFYLAAKSIDEERIAELDSREESLRVPTMSGVSSKSYLPLLMTSILARNTEAHELASVRQNTLALSLIRNGNVTIVLAWGAIVLFLGLLSGTSRPSPHRLRSLGAGAFSEEDEESSLWLLIPGGLFIAGEKPLRGVFGLSIFSIFLLAGLNSPLRLYPLASLDVRFDAPLFFVSALVFLILAALSFLQITRSSKNSMEAA